MFHDPDVNCGSQALVDAHSRNWPTKRILMQVRKLSKIFETAALLSRHATLPSGTVTGDRGKIDHWLTGAFPETILGVFAKINSA